MQLLEQEQQIHQALSQIIAQAWCDSAYEQEFLNNPKSKFADAGVAFSEQVELRVELTNHSNWQIQTQVQDAAGSESKVIYTIPFMAKPIEAIDEDFFSMAELDSSRIIPTCCC